MWRSRVFAIMPQGVCQGHDEIFQDGIARGFVLLNLLEGHEQTRSYSG